MPLVVSWKFIGEQLFYHPGEFHSTAGKGIILLAGDRTKQRVGREASMAWEAIRLGEVRRAKDEPAYVAAAAAGTGTQAILRAVGILLATLAILTVLSSIVGLLITGPYAAASTVIDHATAHWLHQSRSLSLDSLLCPLTWVAEPIPLALVSGALFAFFLARRQCVNAALFGTPMLGMGIMLSIVARIVARQRPEWIVHHELGDFGYPCGHVMNAVILTGIGLYVAFPLLKARWQKAALAALAAAIVLATAASRIYVGAHFATDCPSGFVMGVIWIYTSLRVMSG